MQTLQLMPVQPSSHSHVLAERIGLSLPRGREPQTSRVSLYLLISLSRVAAVAVGVNVKLTWFETVVASETFGAIAFAVELITASVLSASVSREQAVEAVEQKSQK